MKYQILNGDNHIVLKTLPDNSIDSIITDPPYGIDFLGKSWDANTGSLETYRECLRVLKPGGHILAFSAARTYHHLAVTLEQAGFEIRDQIMWIYSSGFPKSQDVGKSIQRSLGVKETSVIKGGARPSDKMVTPYAKENEYKQPILTDPEAKQWEGWGTALKPAQESIVLARKSLGIHSSSLYNNIKEIQILLETIWTNVKPAVETLKKQKTTESIVQDSAIETIRIKNAEIESLLTELLENISPYLGEDSISLNIVGLWNSILEENLPHANTYTIKMETNIITIFQTLKYCLLEIIQNIITQDRKKIKDEKLFALNVVKQVLNSLLNLKDTLTDYIVQESVIEKVGDLHEPICLARKPTKQSIAQNVQRWGTGALNIDATRIPYESEADLEQTKGWSNKAKGKATTKYFDGKTDNTKDDYDKVDTFTEQGRFPSNVIGEIQEPYQKYFYCPKVSRAERHIGFDKDEIPNPLENYSTGEVKNHPLWDPSIGTNLQRLKHKILEHDKTLGQEYQVQGSVGNNHPTVKPVELMKYLIKLVTPPLGKVLDPFNGSGSTGMAAVELGYEYIGIEQDDSYCEISRRRIAAHFKQADPLRASGLFY